MDVSFPSGRCGHEVFNNQANYQGYEYDVYFLQCYTFTVIHLLNNEEVCEISEELFLMYTFV